MAFVTQALSFKAPYPAFWFAAVGLALEGAAGEARRFVLPVSGTPDFSETTILKIATMVFIGVIFYLALKRKDGFVFKSKLWAITIAVLFTVGLALFYQERLFVTSISEICVYGYMLASSVGVVYFLIWFDRIFPYGFKAVLETIAVSIILRGAFQIVLLLLQETPSAAFLVTLPVISLYFYFKVWKANDQYLDEDAIRHNRAYLIVDKNENKRKVIFVSFFIAAFALSFLMNADSSQQLLTPLDSNVSLRQISCIAGNLLAGGVMFGISQTTLNKSTLIVFILIVVGCTCIGLYAANSTTVAGAALTAITLSIARKCIDFLVVFPAFMFCEDGKPHFHWYALSRLLVNIASYLAVLVTTLSSTEFLGGISISGLIVLFIAVVVFFSSASEGNASQTNIPAVTESIPAAPVAQEEIPVRRPFRDALDTIAKDAHFTPTETTVFNLIARGNNAEGVSRELTVSINTAKTHIRNIYAKLNVHSQQELLALVEQKKAEIIKESK